MRHRLSFACAGVAVWSIAACGRQPPPATGGEPPHGGAPPAITTPAKPAPSSPFSTSPAGVELTSLLASVFVTGPDASKRYQQQLERARSQAGVVDELVAAYGKVPPQDYSTRQVLVAMLTDLQLPAAIPSLASIASAAVPERRPVAPHALDPWEEEVLIRVTAVRGLGALTKDRNATERLIGLLGSNVTPIREQAAYWLQQDPALAKQVRDRIPADLRFTPVKPLPPPAPELRNQTPNR
jgi:hypothetical protein